MTTTTIHPEMPDPYNSLILATDDAQRTLGRFLGLDFTESGTVSGDELRARLDAAFGTIEALAPREQWDPVVKPLRDLAEMAAEAQVSEVPVAWTCLGRQDDGDAVGVDPAAFVTAAAAAGDPNAQLIMKLVRDTVDANSASSWEERTAVALHDVLGDEVGQEIVESEAYGALVYRMKQRAQDRAIAVVDVLHELDEDALQFAGRADNPAAFLASRIRDL